MSSFIINEDGTVTENRRVETGASVNPDSVCGQISLQLPEEETVTNSQQGE